MSKIARKETSEEKSWREFFLKSKQQEIIRFEEAAKFITGLVAIILTVAKLFPSFLSSGGIGLLSIVTLFISLIFALLVFYPHNYVYKVNIPSLLPIIHEKVLKKKQCYLWWSTTFLVISLLIFSSSFFISNNDKIIINNETANTLSKNKVVYIITNPAIIDLINQDSTLKKVIFE